MKEQRQKEKVKSLFTLNSKERNRVEIRFDTTEQILKVTEDIKRCSVPTNLMFEMGLDYYHLVHREINGQDKVYVALLIPEYWVTKIVGKEYFNLVRQKYEPVEIDEEYGILIDLELLEGKGWDKEFDLDDLQLLSNSVPNVNEEQGILNVQENEGNLIVEVDPELHRLFTAFCPVEPDCAFDLYYDFEFDTTYKAKPNITTETFKLRDIGNMKGKGLAVFNIVDLESKKKELRTALSVEFQGLELKEAVEEEFNDLLKPYIKVNELAVKEGLKESLVYKVNSKAGYIYYFPDGGSLSTYYSYAAYIRTKDNVSITCQVVDITNLDEELLDTLLYHIRYRVSGNSLLEHFDATMYFNMLRLIDVKFNNMLLTDAMKEDVDNILRDTDYTITLLHSYVLFFYVFKKHNLTSFDQISYQAFKELIVLDKNSKVYKGYFGDIVSILSKIKDGIQSYTKGLEEHISNTDLEGAFIYLPNYFEPYLHYTVSNLKVMLTLLVALTNRNSQFNIATMKFLFYDIYTNAHFRHYINSDDINVFLNLISDEAF